MNKRLQNLVDKGLIPNKGGVYIDSYNQSVNEEISGTITTRVDASSQYFVTEPISCAMRGRNPENPSERSRSNGKYKQRLEMGNNISNTITSAQKDALVAEPQVLTPKRTDFGKQVRKQYESGELDMSRHDMTELEPRTDGVSNTLTSVQKDNLVAEPIDENYPHVREFDKPEEAEQFIEALYEGKATKPDECRLVGGSWDGWQDDRVFDIEGSSPTLDTNSEKRPRIQGEATSYRIRKLTPRECFRLMGVSESDIDKIQQSGVSQSQQYKMAGNSIVVDVLEHIFRKMFVDIGQESQQLSLF